MIQYYHVRKYEPAISMSGGLELLSPKGGKTIAFEVIPAWYFNELKAEDFFEKRVGSARCSEDDNYSKATGREWADKRLKLTKLTVATVIKDTEKNNILLVLTDKERNKYFLVKSPGGTRVYFQDYEEHEG